MIFFKNHYLQFKKVTILIFICNIFVTVETIGNLYIIINITGYNSIFEI